MPDVSKTSTVKTETKPPTKPKPPEKPKEKPLFSSSSSDQTKKSK